MRWAYPIEYWIIGQRRSVITDLAFWAAWLDKDGEVSNFVRHFMQQNRDGCENTDVLTQ